MAWPQGHIFYIGSYREQHEKIFSETTRPRALIFGLYDYLVNLYQVCSNYSLGAFGPCLGGQRIYIGFYREKHKKIF